MVLFVFLGHPRVYGADAEFRKKLLWLISVTFLCLEFQQRNQYVLSFPNMFLRITLFGHILRQPFKT